MTRAAYVEGREEPERLSLRNDWIEVTEDEVKIKFAFEIHVSVAKDNILVDTVP